MEGAKNAISSIYSELTACQAWCWMLYIRHHSRSPLQFKEEKPIIIFISQRKHGGSRKLRDLPKVTQLLRDRAGIQTGSLTPSSVNIHPWSYGIQNSSQVGPGTGIVCDSFCPRAILFPGDRASLSFFSVFTLSVCRSVVPWSLTFRGLYYQKVDPSTLSECVFPNSLLLRDQEGCLFAVPDTRGITWPKISPY